MVSHERYMYIMNPQIPLTNTELFSIEGELTSTGQLVFWKEVNEILHQFDHHAMELTSEELSKAWKNQKKPQKYDQRTHYNESKKRLH